MWLKAPSSVSSVPTATAAPIITGMLGGSVPRLATFSIISNIAVALLAPVIFTLMGSDAGIPFSDALLTISAKVMPLIILPLVLALCLLKISPKVHRAVAEKQAVSFYIWAVSALHSCRTRRQLHHGRAL